MDAPTYNCSIVQTLSKRCAAQDKQMEVNGINDRFVATGIPDLEYYTEYIVRMFWVRHITMREDVSYLIISYQS